MTTSTGRVQRNKDLISQGMKECCDCAVVKPVSEFTAIIRNVNYGVSAYAAARKACRRDRNTKYRAQPGEKAKRRQEYVKRTYGLTLEKWNAMFEKQRGCCAICFTHSSEIKTGLSVDHNHETGEVRGLLCLHCNAGIGNLKEDYVVIKSAFEYLKKHTETASDSDDGLTKGG
jgi:hypothetical protein